MAAEKFSSEMDDRGTVKVTDKLMIQNIDTGAVEYTTVAALIASLSTFAAGQIGFPATQVPSANVNTLDDYEEGTWIPDLQFGGAKVGITYDADTIGTYTKIGNRVFITCRIILTSKGTSVGTVAIYGIPFTTDAVNMVAVSSSCYKVAFANMMHSALYVNKIMLFESTEAGVRTELGNGDFLNDSQVMIGGNYII